MFLKNFPKRILVILILTLASFFFVPPRITPFAELPGIYWSLGRISFNRDLEFKLGLDLAGGSSLTFEADMSDIDLSDRDSAVQGVRNTIERRINLFGVSESVVRTSKVGQSYRVNVELPGVQDTQTAIGLIGQTAQLEFLEISEEDSEFMQTGLTGAHLARARVDFSQNTSQPVVGIEFNEDGAEKFREITYRNVGKPVAIALDGQIISAPVVQQEIIGGSAVITGDFSFEEAETLAVQLNSGALPVPVELIEQRTVEPTLGTEVAEKSLIAGAIGVSMIGLFMLLAYRTIGLVAILSLAIYGLLALSIYKLIPVTLTLPGIAGFILSVGMAADSNILIFERMKEELRSGKIWTDAIEFGFQRAWSSIRDANIAILFIVLILFNPLEFDFLNTSGPVRGFAATLGIGVLVSLFTGVFVTRTFLRIMPKLK